MREVQVTQFQAWDGTRFETAAKAREYEGKSVHQRLAGLEAAQFLAALDGSDPELGEAIELFGRMIGDARRKRGELKWPAARKKAQAAAAALSEASAPEKAA